MVGFKVQGLGEESVSDEGEDRLRNYQNINHTLQIISKLQLINNQTAF